MGFNFPFYGNSYSQLYFSTNGLISFGAGSSNQVNTAIPNTGVPTNMIAAFWDDLVVSSSTPVYYAQGGTAPNRYFIVEWRAVTTFAGSSAFSFETILYENGDILIQHQSLPASYSSTVGIENSRGDDGLQYQYGSSGLSAPKAVRFSHTGTPTPEINLKGNGLSIVDGENTPSTTNFTDFGSANIANATVSHTFTVENLSTVGLTLGGVPPVEISGVNAADFTVSAAPASPVGPGSSTTFTIVFDPSVSGARTASVSIANDDINENPYNFDIKGTGFTAPEMNVRSGSVSILDGDTTPDLADGSDFGSTTVAGGVVDHIFTIENLGSSDLNLSGAPLVVIGGANASDFSVNVDQTSSPVPPDGTTTFRVRFDPSVYGTRSATLSVANNDSDENPYNFNIQGFGDGPEINVKGNAVSIVDGDSTPSSTDNTNFGSANTTGGTVDRIFTIENLGNTDLTLGGTPKVSIGGANAADFSVTGAPASPVAGGSSTTFTVRFDPSALGTRLATINIANDDSNENPYDFSIQGTGIAPEINVKGNGVSIVDGDSTPSATDNTIFGTANVTAGTINRVFTIENLGTDALNLSGTPRVSISGANAADFSVAAAPGSPVAVSGSTTFTVRFDPSALGIRTATLSIANDDLDENPYNFSIQGTGAAPEINVKGSGVSILSGDSTPAVGDSTDFGTAITSGGTVDHVFTIENLGSVDLNLGGTPKVSIDGANAADFTVAADPASPVAGGASTTFTVRFDPSATGVRSATLSIANDDLDENPYSFDVQGTGTAPEMNVKGRGVSIPAGEATPNTADDTDFGNANLSNDGVDHVFTIENLGTDILTLGGTPKVSIGGANAADFTVTAAPASPVAAGVSTTFTVRFDPSASGTRSATISIANDDGDENPYSFDVQGAGIIAPEINVKGNGVSILDGDAAPDVADDTDFGSADVVHGTVDHVFTIENTGSADLALSGTPLVVIGGPDAADFSVSADPLSPVVAGGSTTFTVHFDPSETGARSATLSIASDDADENPYTFNLQGMGSVPELTVHKTGAGSGTVSSDLTGIDCGTTCTFLFDYNAVVTLSATPATGSNFAGWSGACAGSGSCIVSMDVAKTVTAHFSLNTYTLAVGSSGAGSGTVTSAPTGIDCGTTCSFDFDYGTAVLLSATPAAGSAFAGWSGDCSGTGTCTVTVDDAKSVTADFSLLPTYAISGDAGVAGVTLNYTGGSTTADDHGQYSFRVYSGWSGTVTPSMAEYSFSPDHRDYSNVTSDRTGQDYIATPTPYTISGNVGVGGAILAYPGGSTTANGSGLYSFTVPSGWSGTVIPSKSGYTISPASRSYTNVLTNQPAQDYSATSGISWSGTTNQGKTMAFSVASSGTQWLTFSLKVYVSACGLTMEVFPQGPGSITNGQFNGQLLTSGTFAFTGQITSPTTASGTYTFTNWVITGCGTLNASGTWTAGTPLPLPNDFTKSGPANGAVEQSIHPTLSWGATSYPGAYEYCLDSSNNNRCDTSWVSTGANTSVALAGLNINTTYYWQVRANNATGSTYANSNVWWAFTTQNEYTLTITSDHGTVTVTPSQATYHTGDVVQLTAKPAAGWAFVNWADGLTGSANPGLVTIHGNTSVTARYASLVTLNLNSVAANDGWILESSENGNTGGTLNATTGTLFLGDDAARKQYRSVLSFNTGGALPDTAVITTVTLKVMKQTIVGGGNPLSIFKGLMVDIKNGYFGKTAALLITDFQATASKSYGPFVIAPASNWYSLNLTAGKGYVNKLSSNSGLTQLRLRFKLDDNDNTIANYLSLYSGNASPANRPQLIITYYVP